jgi:hypothetical protein
MVLRQVGFAIVMETMEVMVAPQDLLCAMMTSPLVMPFVRGVLFGMHLSNSQETQVVCHQAHCCFEGHTMVGIILEAMAVVPQDLLWAMMMMLPLAGDALHSGHPVRHAPGELARDSGSMSSGTSQLRGSHYGRNHSGGNGGSATRFALTSPLVMPLIRGILFGMCLVNSQETQVVCHQEHPCFKGHTRVGIVLEAMAAATEDLLCAMMMMTMPLMMPFVQGILVSMHLVNSQETQVVCH